MSRMTGHQHTDEASESSRKLTYADFVRLPDDGRRHEFIDGVHYVTASPNFRHDIVRQRLNFALLNHVKSTRAGLVLSIDCVMSFFDIVWPDLVVVLAGQFDILTKPNIKGAPSIVIEVLSPSTSKRDRTLKRDLYERRGVSEYWIVDGTHNTVDVFRMAKNRFAKAERLREKDDDVLVTGLLPGFALPLSELFSEELY
jgi:Uma2 family endonuclease